MTGARRTFEALQNRWVSGEALTPEEESARREYAAQDGVSRREMALFSELAARLDGPAPPPAATFVQRTLAVVRGARLRLVAPGEVQPAPIATGKRGRRVALAASAALLLVAGAGALVTFGKGAPHAIKTSPAARPTPAQPAAVPSLERSELVFASGEVLVGERPATVGKGTLPVGERVRTRAGRACLIIDPQIDVCLEQDSELVLESLAETNVRVRVVHGTVVAALSPRDAQRTFSLAHGAFSATARGTAFAIDAASADGAPQVSVLEGKVEVSDVSGAVKLLPAHSSLTLRDGASSTGAALGRGAEARLLALLAPRELWQGSSLGVLEVGAAEPELRVLVEERGPFMLPLSTFVPARRQRLVLRSASGQQVNLDAQVEAGTVHRVTPPTPSRASRRASENESPPTPSALLVEARQKLAHGDPGAARAIYERLRSTYPTSAEAKTVLVTLGKLELELGAPKRALSAFDGYLRHGGPLGPEALSGKIRALRALGREADERSAIQSYLSRYASGFDAPVLRKRLEALAAP